MLPPASARGRAARSGRRRGVGLQPPWSPHTQALRAAQVPPRSGDGPGQRDRGAGSGGARRVGGGRAGAAPSWNGRSSGSRCASRQAGRGGPRRPPEDGGGTARVRTRQARAANARRVRSDPARGGARTGRRRVRWRGRAGQHAGPSPATARPLPLAKLRHCGLAGRRRPSPAPPSSRPAAPAAAIFWGRHTCPGGEDGGAHHTHKTWLPFKTKTSRATARGRRSPEDHMVTENSPSRVLICTCFCSHFLLPGSAPPPPAAPAPPPR